ncbi:hypothetical protein ACFL4H_00015 [Candidatus Neomarinimicrobiota bacterium]
MSEQFQVPTVPQIGESLSFYTTGSIVSWGIRLLSPGVNHVETFAWNPKSEKIECTSAHADGVYFRPIEQVIREAKGTVRYHKLRPKVRELLDIEQVNACAVELDGASYDFLHLLGVGIDDVHINWLKVFPKVPDWVLKTLRATFENEPTKRAVVCSGVWNWLVLNYGLGLSTKYYNPSEITPWESFKYDLYEDAITVKGKVRPIRNYNSIIIKGVSDV